MNRQTFIFGKPVEGNFFTDREAEAKRLAANFKGGVSTFLLSPRRWGKTSLIKKVMTQVQSDELKVVFVDVFKCKSPIDFETPSPFSAKRFSYICIGRSISLFAP